MDNTQSTPVGDVPDVSMQVEFRSLIEHDPRAAHFIVDILSGVSADDAVGRHFPRTDAGAGGNDAICEAEKRGYLRGLNEAAQARMEEPAMYESPDAHLDAEPQPQSTFLSRSRKSVWD